MKRLRDLPIQRKLTVVILSTSGLALVAACTLMMVNSWAVARGHHEENARSLAEIAATQSTAAVEFDDAAAATEILTALSRNADVQAAVIYRPDGSRFAAWVRPGTHAPDRPTSDGTTSAEGHLIVQRAIVGESGRVGTIHLRLGRASLHAQLRWNALVTLLVLLVGAAAALALASQLQRVITRPILALKGTAEAVARERDTTLRAVKTGNDEMGVLVDRFNEMLTELERRDRALKLAHDELERRVEERTRDLQKEVEERKQAVQELRLKEEQLVQAQKMEAVGRLAGGVAHDFNNMLQAILGFTSLGLAELKPSDPVFSYLEEVRKAGERAASLTRQLLAFSRRQVLNPKILDLNALVSETQRMLLRLIGEHIDLQLDLDPALGRVKADPGQIEQVVLNLVVNARDAMPRGGRMTIRTCNMELGGGDRPSGPHVVLSVIDTGTGMDAATKAHLFEPFFTTKPKGEGTGLGLSTVYGIVRQSGGQVWVESEPARGTTFHVALPRADEENAARRDTRTIRAIASGVETVLLVEDESSVRSLVRDILRRNGYRVLEARNGREGVDVCAQHEDRIHLLLTDVVMPGMSGRELAERVTAARPDIRVVYMSGFTEDAMVHHGVLTDKMPFLNKPFRPEALLAKVREVLDAPQPAHAMAPQVGSTRASSA